MSVRTNIVAALESVPGIGMVHSQLRYSTSLTTLKELYCSPIHQGQLRGWHIERIGLAERGAIYERSVATSRWAITGFLALQDESESGIVFDDLLDAIRTRFRNETFNQTVHLVEPETQIAYAQIESVDQVMFAGVLCHRARIILNVTEYVQ